MIRVLFISLLLVLVCAGGFTVLGIFEPLSVLVCMAVSGLFVLLLSGFLIVRISGRFSPKQRLLRLLSYIIGSVLPFAACYLLKEVLVLNSDSAYAGDLFIICVYSVLGMLALVMAVNAIIQVIGILTALVMNKPKAPQHHKQPVSEDSL